MSDKEKAYETFEKLLNNEIKKHQKCLDAKIIKNMNAVGDEGVTYTCDADIQDAYGYDLITDAERIIFHNKWSFGTKFSMQNICI